jgi:hypothetical protein
MTAVMFPWRETTIIVPSWVARIPEVRAEEAVHAQLVGYFHGNRLGLERANNVARNVVQETFSRAWVDGLRRCVGRRALEYANGWPQLVEAGPNRTSTLRGFDPRTISSMYVPFQNTGRAGLTFARQMLADMAHKAGAL